MTVECTLSVIDRLTIVILENIDIPREYQAQLALARKSV